VLKLGGLLAETEGKDQRGYLWLKIAEKNVKNASLAAAEAALDTIARDYPATPFPERIAGLRARIEQRGEVRIGVLLPLMKSSPESPAREIGVGLLNGIEFATEEYNSDPSVRVKVTLDVRDTERDPLATTRIVQELTANSGILAIVGPAFSNPALAAVGLANARGVPLITPTANSNGIASVGLNIFQANPDYETRGKAMARFAVQRLGHRTFAVLAPIDTYSKYMAESFMREALRLGARIVASEWYQRGASDFSMQLRNIRRTALADAGPPLIAFSGRMSREVVAGLVHLGVPVERVDSLLSQGAVVDAERLLGPRARFLMDSLGIEPRVTEVPVDSMESAVTSIDGFYVPIGMPEEIGAVASQIVYFNFETTLLGSGEWNSVPELDANKRYCTDVFFESDSYVDSSDPAYASFVDRYFRRYKDRPGRNTLYGYDTMSLILSVIRSGAAQRAHLARDLALVKEYKGLHSRIGFSGDRVNSWLRILKFDGERIVPVEEIDVR
jgi:ABC-type branched-subunit amino acid transport system substrate-binding protein